MQGALRGGGLAPCFPVWLVCHIRDRLSPASYVPAGTWHDGHKHWCLEITWGR